ncbi:hypothetical protein D917_03928 [Trichinella nativa]|uniref:Uncharacterized protein n=1 Tax=Trichinella nativa TaxID=6335 RepID=A0A1Y3E6B6_9BILA|nr:hypothetical protein D917_03928 [Trichinella nativa]
MCGTLYVEPKTYVDLLALYQSMRNMPPSQYLLFSASCSSLQNCRKGDESGLLKYFRGGIFCYFRVSLYVYFCLTTCCKTLNTVQTVLFATLSKVNNQINAVSAVNNPMNLPPASRMAEAWACVDKNFPTASQASVNIEINGDL